MKARLDAQMHNKNVCRSKDGWSDPPEEERTRAFFPVKAGAGKRAFSPVMRRKKISATPCRERKRAFIPAMGGVQVARVLRAKLRDMTKITRQENTYSDLSALLAG